MARKCLSAFKYFNRAIVPPLTTRLFADLRPTFPFRMLGVTFKRRFALTAPRTGKERKLDGIRVAFTFFFLRKQLKWAIKRKLKTSRRLVVQRGGREGTFLPPTSSSSVTAGIVKYGGGVSQLRTRTTLRESLP